MMRAIMAASLLLGLIGVNLAQTQNPTLSPTPKPGEIRRNETTNERDNRMIEDSFRQLQNLGQQTTVETAESLLARNLPEPRMTKEQKALISPAKDDSDKYADFLKLQKTGIFKILSAQPCGNKLVVDVSNEKCLNRTDELLSFYSFRKQKYADLAWSDLSYEDTQFLVGFQRRTIGLIAELGDVPIETIDKDSSEVKSLSGLEMPQKVFEINNKKEEIKNGISVGSLKVSNQIEAKPNQTYLLRSYAYRAKGDAFNDRRVDIIIVFKIVKMEENKTLTIIWKELSAGKTFQL